MRSKIWIRFRRGGVSVGGGCVGAGAVGCGRVAAWKA